jgi:uncharacterized membrane protein YhaH (DUF805 family)
MPKRDNRAAYWLQIGLVILLRFVLPELIHFEYMGTLLLVLWAGMYIRRLHDIGRSGWWCLVAVFAFVPVCVALIFGGPGFVAVLLHHRGEVTDLGSDWYIAALVGSILLQHSFTIWLGIQPGTDGDNRFGPQPAEWHLPGHLVRSRPKSD